MESETAVAKVQPTIKLDSSDGEQFDVELDVIKQSKLISAMLLGVSSLSFFIQIYQHSDLGMDENSAETMATPIPLENVSASILKKVTN